MTRAVHGLHAKLALVDFGEVHIVDVVVVVAGGLPERDVHDLGSDDLTVVILLVEVADVLDEPVIDDRALGIKEGRGGCLGQEREKLELFSELAVVALLGFFDEPQVLVEFRLRAEGSAVDALELRVLFVPAPVGASDGEELERFDGAGRGHVRAAAQVGEVAFAIGRNRRRAHGAPQRLDDFDLEGPSFLNCSSASATGCSLRTKGWLALMIVAISFSIRGRSSGVSFTSRSTS